MTCKGKTLTQTNYKPQHLGCVSKQASRVERTQEDQSQGSKLGMCLPDRLTAELFMIV